MKTVKINLKHQHTWCTKTYGPGEVEVPEHMKTSFERWDKLADARERKRAEVQDADHSSANNNTAAATAEADALTAGGKQGSR